MVRNYVRKTNRGSWTVSQIMNAITDVLDKGKSCYSAAKTYGIPHSTLVTKVRQARSLNTLKPAKIPTKMPSIPQKEDQLKPISIIEQSCDDEDSMVSEDSCLEVPNGTEDAIAINNDQVKESEGDVCQLYGQLLAKKLMQFPELERLKVMYEIDGIILNRIRSYEP